jgi:hypothetical protein
LCDALGGAAGTSTHPTSLVPTAAVATMEGAKGSGEEGELVVVVVGCGSPVHTQRMSDTEQCHATVRSLQTTPHTHTSSRAWLCISKSTTSVISYHKHSHSFVASHMRIRSFMLVPQPVKVHKLCLTCLSPTLSDRVHSVPAAHTTTPRHEQTPPNDHHVHAHARTCTRLIYVSLPLPPMGNSLTATCCVLLLCFRVRFCNLLLAVVFECITSSTDEPTL